MENTHTPQPCKKLSLQITAIALGVIAVAATTYIVDQKISTLSMSIPDPSTISVEEATQMTADYLNYAPAPDKNDKLFGFQVSQEIYAQMGRLFRTDTVIACRVYFGLEEETGTPSRIVCGVGTSEKDITKTLYRAEAQGSGFCPTLCDVISQMTTPLEGEIENTCVEEFGSQISLETAQKLHAQYRAVASPLTEKLTNYSVSRDLYSKMRLILITHPNVVGFRVYLGVSICSPPANVLVVCGVNEDGSDETETILTTEPTNSGICPPLCDEASPIDAR